MPAVEHLAHSNDSESTSATTILGGETRLKMPHDISLIMGLLFIINVTDHSFIRFTHLLPGDSALCATDPRDSPEYLCSL